MNGYRMLCADNFARAGFTPLQSCSNARRWMGPATDAQRSCLALAMAPPSLEIAEARQHGRERKRDCERRHEKRREPVPGAARVEHGKARVYQTATTGPRRRAMRATCRETAARRRRRPAPATRSGRQAAPWQQRTKASGPARHASMATPPRAWMVNGAGALAALRFELLVERDLRVQHLRDRASGLGVFRGGLERLLARARDLAVRSRCTR